MRPKSLILLLLALACGLVAAVGINQVLANRPVQDVIDTTEMVPIFVSLTDIGLGDPLVPEVLKLEEWPKSKVPAGAMTKLEEVEGRRARTKFFAGEPIIEAKLLTKGDQGSGATDLIPRGFRVVSVKIDDASGSGLILLPGDRVDALVHIKDHVGTGDSNRSSTRTFLHNVKVFAVNNVYSRESNGNETITAKTVSLLVMPQQAELVTFASQMGEIRLVMRSADDDSQDETDGVMLHELVGGHDSGGKPGKPAAPGMNDLMKMMNTPKKEEAPAMTVAAPPVNENAWKMIMIQGETVSEVEFTNGNRVGSSMQIRQLSGPNDGGGGGMPPMSAMPPAALGVGPMAPPEPNGYKPPPEDGP